MQLSPLQAAALHEAATMLNQVTIDGNITAVGIEKLHRANTIVTAICEAVRRDWVEEKAREGGERK